MGTWGPGNLDNDRGRDFLFQYIDSLAQIINGLMISKESVRKVFHDSSEAHIMILIEIIIVLENKFGEFFTLFNSKDVERWRDIYLEAFDEYALDAGYGDFTNERRPVIEETFEKLRQIAIDHND